MYFYTISDGSEVKIGEFNGVTEQLDLTRGHVIKWHGRAPPKDRTLEIIEQSHVNITIYSVLAATASVGIVMAITFLVINITYRNQRWVRWYTAQTASGNRRLWDKTEVLAWSQTLLLKCMDSFKINDSLLSVPSEKLKCVPN